MGFNAAGIRLKKGIDAWTNPFLSDLLNVIGCAENTSCMSQSLTNEGISRLRVPSKKNCVHDS
jgi:hypothetical protein